MGLLHMVTNLAALIPLMDRFECEHGTITTVALFFGRMFTACFFAFRSFCLQY